MKQCNGKQKSQVQTVQAGRGGSRLLQGEAFWHWADIIDDLTMARPHQADGLWGTDAGCTRVAGRAKPVILGGTCSSRTDVMHVLGVRSMCAIKDHLGHMRPSRLGDGDYRAP